MLKYDITKTGKENILPLLNASAKEGVVVTAADVAFGAPTASTDQSGANTKVTLTVVEGSTVVNGKSEPLDRFYTRLDLGETIIALGVDIDVDAKLTAEQDDAAKIAAFIAATGINLDPADLTIAVADSKATFTVVAGHHGLIGSAEVAVAPPVLPYLEEVFTDPVLKGFADPEEKG